ncbi:MAG: NAD(P)H-dependent oxidoreductase [Pyrinomonadaceae bacterium]
MEKFTFIIASARPNGNSEQLARIAAERLEAASTEWLALRDFPIPAFEDLRHNGEPYAAPEGNALKLYQATADCDHLVFVTPLYWYNVPATLKLYLDHWSHWLRVESLNFRERMNGKRMWAISVSAGPASKAEPMFKSLELSADYMNMIWSGHVLGNGSAAGDVLRDSAAIEKAKSLFENIPAR